MGCNQSQSSASTPATPETVPTPDPPAEKKEEEKPKPLKQLPHWPILEVGKEAIVARHGGFVGTIVKSTTTEVQLRTRDGKEDWYETEEVMAYGDRSPPDSKVLQKGKMVTTRNGVQGELVEKTTTEVCLKVKGNGPEGDDTSVWVAVEDIMFLRVHIVRATELRNADTFSLSDPYCICELSGKPESKVKTEFVSDNLNPRWDYQTNMICFEKGDELKFKIYDSDLIKSDDLLGVTSLGSDELTRERDGFIGFAGDLKLTDGDGKPAQGSLTVKVVLENSKPEPVEPPPKKQEAEITYASERNDNQKSKACCW